MKKKASQSNRSKRPPQKSKFLKKLKKKKRWIFMKKSEYPEANCFRCMNATSTQTKKLWNFLLGWRAIKSISRKKREGIGSEREWILTKGKNQRGMWERRKLKWKKKLQILGWRYEFTGGLKLITARGEVFGGVIWANVLVTCPTQHRELERERGRETVL